MKTLLPYLLVPVLLLGCRVNSTDDQGTGDQSTSEGIAVKLTADRNPAFMETTTLSCTYEVAYPILPEGRDDYVVTGHFVLPRTHFLITSGDSSWVDTVKVNTSREHRVVVQAIKRGNWLVDAFASSIIVDKVSVIGGEDSVELHVN